MAHDVFISHAGEDKPIAEAVCALLERRGIRCWIAPRDIRPGADWPSRIVEAIQQSKALVLVFSAHANASREIPKEVAQAARHGLSIITLRIEDVAPAGSLDYNLSTVHWLDALTAPVERHIERLADTLVPILDERQPEPPPSSRPWIVALWIALVFAASSWILALDMGGFDVRPRKQAWLWNLLAPLPAAAFGWCLATLLRLRWQERVATGVLAMLAFYLATSAADLLDGSVFQMPFGGMVAAGAVGSLGITLAVTIWRPLLIRALAFLTLVGAAAGAAFFGFVVLSGVFRETGADGILILAAFFAWQFTVGGALILREHGSLRAVPISRSSMISAIAGSVTLLAVNSVLNAAWPLETTRLVGQTETNPKDNLEYAWVRSGSFQMGCSPEDDSCFSDESPSRSVTISQGFWIGESEVTTGAWRRVMNALPPEPVFFGVELNPEFADADLPITMVTWQDAAAYCEAVGGRLPTEAEWEYAARAGTDRARYRRVDESAWYANNSGNAYLNAASIAQDRYPTLLSENRNGPKKVGSFGYSSNPWGIQDTLGNVAEWVADDYGDQSYAVAASEDPLYRSGASREALKVTRGGSWFTTARSVRVSARQEQKPDLRSSDVGFRCVWNGPSE